MPFLGTEYQTINGNLLLRVSGNSNHRPHRHIRRPLPGRTTDDARPDEHTGVLSMPEMLEVVRVRAKHRAVDRGMGSIQLSEGRTRKRKSSDWLSCVPARLTFTRKR